MTEGGNLRALKKIYDQAQAELERKLRKLTRQDRGDTFTAYQARALLAQVRQGEALIAKQMAGHLGSMSKDAQIEALRGLEKDIAKLDMAFTGRPLQLPIAEASRFQNVVKGRSTSLLRQHETSMNTWGADTVQAIEKQMTLSIATGESVDEAVGRIVETSDAQWWRADRVARTECLPGDALVSGAVVRAVHRRWFEGAMAEIVTEGGRQLSATTNHPMLTRRGWVGAGDVREGDDLICYGGDQHPLAARDEHVQGGPTTIAQIFDAVAAVGISERRRTGKPDFHGDGSDGDVDISCSDRELQFGVFATLTKPSIQNVLTPSDLSALSFCAGCGNLLSGSLASQARSGRHIAQCYACCFDAIGDQSVADANGARQFDDAFALDVALDDLRIWRPCAQIGGPSFSTAAPIIFGQVTGQATTAQVGHEPIDRHVDQRRYLATAVPSEIKFDRVVEIRVRPYRGHVFNLLTPHGYYAFNGTITGNTSHAFNGTAADAIHDAQDEIPDMRLRWVEYCNDETGAPLDSRVAVDSIAIHAELAVGGLFTMPETAPHADAHGNTEVPAALIGKTWPHPPDRPNDRALVQAWRPAWPVPAWVLRNGRRAPAPRK